ncbi:MAG: hypothetical protein HXY39_17380 [Chloroflexi bacterium]|nr:hypothetical protein [Chloroflexota bacterium]
MGQVLRRDTAASISDPDQNIVAAWPGRKGNTATGRRLWRLVHFLSFVVFALALAHGVSSGSDSQTDMARVLYWSSGTSVLFLTIYRILVSIVKRTGSTRSTAPMRHS